jgi:hypothetical protein
MPERITMIEPTLFSLAGTSDFDLARTGGMRVAVDETFATTVRIQLDDTSWLDHIQGWLAGDAELMEVLMSQAAWEQRSRWMYTRTVQEPRLTAEYPVIADAPQPVLPDLAEILSAHCRRPYERLWMNWYRDNHDGTPPPWTTSGRAGRPGRAGAGQPGPVVPGLGRTARRRPPAHAGRRRASPDADPGLGVRVPAAVS